MRETQMTTGVDNAIDRLRQACCEDGARVDDVLQEIVELWLARRHARLNHGDVTASAEPLTGWAIRVHPYGGSWEQRSPYSWAAAARAVDSHTLEVLAVSMPLIKPEMAALLRLARDNDFRKILQRRVGKPDHLMDVKLGHQHGTKLENRYG